MLHRKGRYFSSSCTLSSSSVFVSTFSSSSTSSFIASQYSWSFSCCFSRSLKTLSMMVYEVSLDTLRTDAATEAPLSKLRIFSPWSLRRALKSVADFFRIPPAFVLFAFSACSASRAFWVLRVCFLVVGRPDCGPVISLVAYRLTRRLPPTTHISRLSRESGFLAG